MVLRGKILIVEGILLFLGIGFLCSAEYRDVLQFLDEERIELQWNPYLKIGNFLFGYSVVSFRTQEPWIVVNYREKIRIDPIREERGTLLLTKRTEDIIRSALVGSRKPGPRVGAIFIDPGHGGKDPGTIGRYQVGKDVLELKEKDIVLATSLILADLLKKAYPDKQILLSRDDDRYLTLEERTELANALSVDPEDAVIFISIHVNASLNPKAKGFEVWYLPPQYRRNLIDHTQVEEPYKEIVPILNSMLEEEFTIESILLAKHILDSLQESIGSSTENRGLKEESWFVVRKAKMPSVLVEIGFITNEEEAILLNQQEYLKKIAQAIYNGIVRFIGTIDNPILRTKVP
ncbi:MAG TPA: N-acetylmuramoyl-L-alanine amidase [Spirochaetales bacterium]|nr:N-acetylmuramoyl-L-alanine amidase [Spirochaetales bacterium]